LDFRVNKNPKSISQPSIFFLLCNQIPNSSIVPSNSSKTIWFLHPFNCMPNSSISYHSFDEFILPNLNLIPSFCKSCVRNNILWSATLWTRWVQTVQPLETAAHASNKFMCFIFFVVMPCSGMSLWISNYCISV